MTKAGSVASCACVVGPRVVFNILFYRTFLSPTENKILIEKLWLKMEKSNDNFDVVDDDDDDAPFRKLKITGSEIAELSKNNEVIIRYEEDNSDVFNDTSDIYLESCLEELEKRKEVQGSFVPEGPFEQLWSKMDPLDSEGYVRKQTIVPGTGKEIPEQAVAIIHYNFYKENDETPFDSTYLRNRPYKFRLDEGLIPGLSLAVKSMRKGENSRFIIKYQFAFGEHGIPPRIPPACDIFADVTLKDFSASSGEFDPNAPDQATKKTFEESLQEVIALRHQGNNFFGSRNFLKAIGCYKRADNIMNRMHLANEEEEKKMLDSKNKTLINLAISYNEVRRPESACVAAQEVLKREPNNAKALLQLGKAKYYLSDCHYAKSVLMRTKKLVPSCRQADEYLKKIDEKLAKNKILEEEFCKKAFQN